MDLEKRRIQNYTEDQLTQWGMLRHVQRESIIDEHIKEIETTKIKIDQMSLQNLWCKNQGIKSKEDLYKWQSYHGLKKHSWEELVLRQWKWTEWCYEEFLNEIPTYYLKKKPFLDKVSYSIISVKNKNLASELFLRIKEGESSFEKIAATFSEGAERKSGGKLGPVHLGQPHPEIGQTLKISNINQLWPPKLVESWWVILRLDEILKINLDVDLKRKLSVELGELYLNNLIDKGNYMNEN